MTEIRARAERVDRAGCLAYTSGMRVSMILVLCVLVALQGMASPRLPETPCPMMQAISSTLASMAELDGDEADDCCNDAETALKTGQPCKSGQACSAPAAWALPALPAAHLQSVFSSGMVSSSGSFPPHVYPVGVWRPPTPS